MHRNKMLIFQEEWRQTLFYCNFKESQSKYAILEGITEKYFRRALQSHL